MSISVSGGWIPAGLADVLKNKFFALVFGIPHCIELAEAVNVQRLRIELDFAAFDALIHSYNSAITRPDETITNNLAMFACRYSNQGAHLSAKTSQFKVMVRV
jgi:hypothetical protein